MIIAAAHTAMQVCAVRLNKTTNATVQTCMAIWAAAMIVGQAMYHTALMLPGKDCKQQNPCRLHGSKELLAVSLSQIAGPDCSQACILHAALWHAEILVL